MRTNRDLNDARDRDDDCNRDDGCDCIWNLLSVYADSEATSDEAAMVETHLAVCADCTRDLAFLRAATTLLQSVPAVAPPAELRSAIFAATIDRPNRLPWWKRAGAGLRTIVTFTPARYGALAAGAAALAFVMLRAGQDGNVVPGVPVLPGSRTPQNLAQMTPPGPRLSSDNQNQNIYGGAEDVEMDETLTPEMSGAPSVKPAVITTRTGTPAVVVPSRRPNAPRPTGQYAVASGGGQRFSTGSMMDRANGAGARPVIMAARLEEGMPEPPADMLGMAGAGMGDMNSMGMAAGNDMMTGGKVEMVKEPSAHIQLAADIQPIPSGQMVSLADLKRALRRQNSEQMARTQKSALETGMDRQIRLDVYRGRF